MLPPVVRLLGRKSLSKNLRICSRAQSSLFSSKSMKVALLGAATKTGRCLSLFLKQSPLIDELAICDDKCTRAMALELNYINARCKVNACSSDEGRLRQALQGAKIVMIISDGTSVKNSSPDEVLKTNAEVLSDLLPNIIKFCPQAMVGIAMSRTNSLIPLATEMYKRAGIFEHTRLFGVTTLDCVRANTFASELIGIEPECVTVPVIGGCCSETCIPIFSQMKPRKNLSQVEANRLTHAVRMCDEELLKLNGNKEASCFGAAFAAARFCMSLCKALRHQSGVVECAYVRSCVIPQVTYFAAPIQLGPDGIQKHLGIPPLSDHECTLLATAIPGLKKAIARGEALALGHKNATSEVCFQHQTTQHQTVG